MSDAGIFTFVFLFALALTTFAQIALALRHMLHVSEHRAAVPAAFAEAVTLQAHQRAADYTFAKGKIGLIETVLGAFVLLAFTVGGGLDALIAEIRGWLPGGATIWRDLALFGAFAVISGVIDLPFALYRIFVIEQRFGFNQMTWRLYVLDSIKGTLLGLAIGAPLAWVALWLMAQTGPLWWLWLWAVWAVFNLTMLVLFPTVIAPLFNKFTPLTDDALKAGIEKLLVRCGFQSSGLFVMDGSRRSAHGNAYFSGIGASKRIVLFDTLISKLAPAEIEAVLAHELGHFKKKHIVQRIVTLFALSFGFLALLGWLSGQSWFYSGLGITQASHGATLLLFALVLPVFTFVLQPLSSIVSRKHEYEADAFAAQHANARDLISALVKLYRENAATLTPDPLFSAFYDSHPPAALRIAHLEKLQAV